MDGTTVLLRDGVDHDLRASEGVQGRDETGQSQRWEQADSTEATEGSSDETEDMNWIKCRVVHRGARTKTKRVTVTACDKEKKKKNETSQLKYIIYARNPETRTS